VLKNSNLTSTIHNVQALPSHESSGIQLADILTGIVTAKFNNKTTSTAKNNLIQHIEKNYLGHKIRPTPKGSDKFNIFKINLRGGW
ncbi:MAG: DUF3800 domain-containing protein, partial [Chlorobi bacterium]|nr:DUF3800 domain-containing protein [Chlorobiota bacterium]